ncbi:MULTISPECIES: hypothetical protein [Paraburkholderia]|uniref:Uncharacterized protein n=1 Tax=Paraburkholderia unamae TaxID=219649 RepID=A0ACC6RT31_9BURK
MLPTIRNSLRQGACQIHTEYPRVIATALKEEPGDARRAIKTLTRWTGASERTVQNWLSAVRGPSGPDMIALAQHSSAVHNAYLIMAGRSADPTAEIGATVLLLREALVLLTSGRQNG